MRLKIENEKFSKFTLIMINVNEFINNFFKIIKLIIKSLNYETRTHIRRLLQHLLNKWNSFLLRVTSSNQYFFRSKLSILVKNGHFWAKICPFSLNIFRQKMSFSKSKLFRVEIDHFRPKIATFLLNPTKFVHFRRKFPDTKWCFFLNLARSEY